MTRRLTPRFSILAFLACVAWLPAIAVTEPYYQPHYCKNAFTYPQEIAEGRKAEQQIYKQMQVLPDSSPITQYVQQIGGRLVSYAPGYKWPYRFHVVDSKQINAFALPGGAIFVNTGTIAAAQNESQLAGVMAHEISHVVQRHSTCNQTKEAKPKLAWGLADLLAGMVPGIGGVLAENGIGMMQGLGYLQMSRTDEKQADLLGTEILYNAGYNPRGLVQMFQIIEEKYGAGGTQFLSDHPNPGNRVEYVDKELAALPPKSHWISDTPEFDKIHALVVQRHGVSAEQGVSAAPEKPLTRLRNITASQTFTTFQHQGYSLSYPENWKLYGDSGSIVTIAPSGGILAGSGVQDQVAYGVIVDGFDPDPGASLNEGTRQLVDSLQQSNPKLREIGSAENMPVNGADGRSVELENTSPLSSATQPVTERDWLVTVEEPGGQICYLIFIAPQEDYRTLHPVFLDILHSFRLTDASGQ